MSLDDDSKLSKMRQLTEPVVAELLSVVRHMRASLRHMRSMTDFADLRDQLQLLVELRNLLAEQPLVPGAVYSARDVPPESHYAPEAAARLAAVAAGSLSALWQIEMKLYNVRNEIARVDAVPRAVELTMLLRHLRNAVPVDVMAAADESELTRASVSTANSSGSTFADDASPPLSNYSTTINGNGVNNSVSAAPATTDLSPARQALLNDGLSAEDVALVHEISSADGEPRAAAARSAARHLFVPHQQSPARRRRLAGRLRRRHCTHARHDSRRAASRV